MFPFFQSPGTLPDCHDLSNITENGFTISQLPQDFTMHLIRSHRLMYIQVPQVVQNLVFHYSGKGILGFGTVKKAFKSTFLEKRREDLRIGKLS